MLSPLRGTEVRIERLLERDFIKLLQYNLHPITVARELAKALEKGAICSSEHGNVRAAAHHV